MNPEGFERNLLELQQMLRDGARPPNFENFERQRRITVTTIEEVIDKLNAVAVSANYAQEAGNITTIIGGLGTMLGAILSLAGVQNASKIADIASLLTKTGDVTSTVADVTEKGLSRLYLNEVEDSLTADKNASVEIREYLAYSRNLDARVRALFGCSLESNCFRDVVSVFRACSNFHRIGSSQIEHFRDLLGKKTGKFARSISDDFDSSLACFSKFIIQAQVTPGLKASMRTTCDVLQASIGMCELYYNGQKFFGAGSAEVELPATSVILQPTQGTVLKCCILETINIAANVLSLLRVKTVISTGQSHYSESLKELKFQLQQELVNIERLFP